MTDTLTVKNFPRVCGIILENAELFFVQHLGCTSENAGGIFGSIKKLF